MKKILIVDDEPMMAKMAVRGLKNDFETFTAESGAAALTFFEENRPDMVISDIMMPEMSGFELCEKIKATYGDGIPFIFMTADETEEGESRGRSVGATAFIRKPVKADAILAAVNAAFDGTTAAPQPAPQDSGGFDLKAEKAKLPDWLLHEPLIDIDTGITNSEAADAYLSSMDIFMAHVDENVTELCRCFDAGDFENYTIKSHALKSTSRIIGAMILSMTAAAMERAGLDHNHDFIRQEHEGFIALYKKYQKLIGSHADDGAGEEIPGDELSDIMMALKEYAMSEDYNLVESTLDTLKNYKLPEETKTLVEKIKENLNRLDWDNIKVIMGV